MGQEPVVLRFPSAPASRCLAQLAQRLDMMEAPEGQEVDFGTADRRRSLGMTGTYAFAQTDTDRARRIGLVHALSPSSGSSHCPSFTCCR